MKKWIIIAILAALLAFALASAAFASATSTHVGVRVGRNQLWPGRRLTAPARLKGRKVIRYQWQRCNTRGKRCQNIKGAKKRTYVVRRADVGHTLRALVVTLNGAVGSSPTGVVGHGRPKNTVLPAITDDGAGSGTVASPLVGDDLGGSAGTWNTETVGFAYQWFDCVPSGATPPAGFAPTTTLNGLSCAPGAGNSSPTAETSSATAPTYTLTDSDVSFEIVLEVTGYNT